MTLDRSSASRLEESSVAGNRVRVFVDYWNLAITMRENCASIAPGDDFRFNWERLPGWLASTGADICGYDSTLHEGTHIYASYDPQSEGDRRFRGWVLNWLARQPGVQVNLKERRRKDPPTCPVCHEKMNTCSHCGSGLARTQEKGVDTAIVTDMIRLAWEQAFDIAVLVTSDSDLVPAVEFLDLRGRKVVQAGFPPAGATLAKACWASFDIFARRDEFRRL